MAQWPTKITDRIVTERHFGRDGLRCFRGRPDTLNAMVAQAVAANPDGDAMVCDGVRTTYAELDARVASCAAGLAACGVGRGDRVAMLLSNGPEFLIVLLATIRCGAIAVPINVREGTPELAHILNDCGAVLLVHDAGVAARLPEAAALTQLRHRYSVGGPADRAVAYHELEESRGAAEPAERDEDDIAVILYTSGTTGNPKGAMLTHLNIIHSAMHFELCMEMGPGERSLLAVPASHVTGLVATLFTMLRTAGCSVILRAFDAHGFLKLVETERVTQALMVPAMYNLFLLRCNVADYDLGHWRIGGYGGAPMAQSTVQALSEKLPQLELINVYGSTEVTSPATILPMGYGVARSDSVGLAVPCGEIRIMDEDGRETAAGAPGELWIKGPMVVPGYWNNAEKTATEFRDGFWKSGDIGSCDADGFVRLHDRRKDMIIRGGYNIYSAEVENALTAHPDIIECAAIGRPDPVLGEKLEVVIYTEAEGLTAEAVQAFSATRLADYKTPDFVVFSDTPLPRNANGKIVKTALRRRD